MNINKHQDMFDMSEQDKKEAEVLTYPQLIQKSMSWLGS